MPTRIDHVIAGAADFRALEAAFARLGFHVTGGGLHPWGGTRNRIIVLGEGYIELLGIADAAKASRALTERFGRTSAGWVGFALQSADIQREAAEMRERGVDARGPTAGQLVAPSGVTRGWHTVMLGGEDLWAAAEPVPFLIQHHSKGAVHQVELAGAGGLSPHTNGVTRLCEVSIAVRDLDQASERFRLAYDLRPQGDAVRDDGLGASALTMQLASGERIVLAKPTGPGIAHERIERAGEGVCRVSVTADLHAAAAFLHAAGVGFQQAPGSLGVDTRDTLGIPLRFEEAT